MNQNSAVQNEPSLTHSLTHYVVAILSAMKGCVRHQLSEGLLSGSMRWMLERKSASWVVIQWCRSRKQFSCFNLLLILISAELLTIMIATRFFDSIAHSHNRQVGVILISELSNQS